MKTASGTKEGLGSLSERLKQGITLSCVMEPISCSLLIMGQEKNHMWAGTRGTDWVFTEGWEMADTIVGGVRVGLRSKACIYP